MARSGSCSKSERCRSIPGSSTPRLPGPFNPGHRVHGGPPPRSRLFGAGRSGSSTSRCPAWPYDWQPMLFVNAIITMIVGHHHRHVPDDVKRDAGLPRAVAHTVGSSSPVSSAAERGRIGGDVLFYLFAYGFSTSARSSALAGSRAPRRRRGGDHADPGGRPGAVATSRSWAWVYLRCIRCWPLRRVSRSPAASSAMLAVFKRLPRGGKPARLRIGPANIAGRGGRGNFIKGYRISRWAH